VLTLEALIARRDRLERLSRGLAKELAAVRKGNDPLLYLERKKYLAHIGDAREGLETARVLLAAVVQRLRPPVESPSPDGPFPQGGT